MSFLTHFQQFIGFSNKPVDHLKQWVAVVRLRTRPLLLTRLYCICELPALSQADIAAIQTRVSQRVLRWFVRRGWLGADEARAMRDWHNDGGFSLDAALRIPAWDRAGLERLLPVVANFPVNESIGDVQYAGTADQSELVAALFFSRGNLEFAVRSAGK